MYDDGIICFRSILIKEVMKWWRGSGNWIHIFTTKPMVVTTVVLSIVEVFSLWIISKQWIHLCSMFRWRYHHRIYSHLINIKTLVQPIILVLIENENKTNKNEIEQWDTECGFEKLKFWLKIQTIKVFNGILKLLVFLLKIFQIENWTLWTIASNMCIVLHLEFDCFWVRDLHLKLFVEYVWDKWIIAVKLSCRFSFN